MTTPLHSLAEAVTAANDQYLNVLKVRAEERSSRKRKEAEGLWLKALAERNELLELHYGEGTTADHLRRFYDDTVPASKKGRKRASSA